MITIIEDLTPKACLVTESRFPRLSAGSKLSAIKDTVIKTKDQALLIATAIDEEIWVRFADPRSKLLDSILGPAIDLLS